MPETPELLDKLLRAGGPSGYEGPAAADLARGSVLRRLSAPTGSAPRSPGSARPRPLLAVVGHIDEIGLVVTHIDEKGFLWFAPIGGWDPQILVGQRVEVHGQDGLVPGVVGRKPIHLLDADQRKKVVELKGLHIDIGAADRDEAAELVRVGDPVVIAAEPVRARRRPPRLALDGQPARRLRRARGAAPLPRARHAERQLRRGRRGPGGDRALRRPHLGLRRSGPTSRSPSTSPTRPTPPGSTRRSSAATRSAPAR